MQKAGFNYADVNDALSYYGSVLSKQGLTPADYLRMNSAPGTSGLEGLKVYNDDQVTAFINQQNQSIDPITGKQISNPVNDPTYRARVQESMDRAARLATARKQADPSWLSGVTPTPQAPVAPPVQPSNSGFSMVGPSSTPAPTSNAVVGRFVSPSTGNWVTYDAAGTHTDTGQSAGSQAPATSSFGMVGNGQQNFARGGAVRRFADGGPTSLGYEHDQLLRRYGLTTPELSYAGALEPTSGDDDFATLKTKYDTDQSDYSKWLTEYRNRINAFNLYGPGYQGEALGAPTYTHGYQAQKTVDPKLVEAAGTVSQANTAGGASGTDNSRGTSGGTMGVNDFGHTAQDAINTPFGGLTASALSHLGLLGNMTQDPTNVSVEDANVQSIGDISAGMHAADDNALAGFDSSQADANTGSDTSSDSSPSDSSPSDSSPSDSSPSDSNNDAGNDHGGDSDGGTANAARGGLMKLHRKYAGGGEVYTGFGGAGEDPAVAHSPEYIGGGQSLSPDLRALILQDAQANGISDPATTFSGGAAYGLKPIPEAKPSAAANLLDLAAKYASRDTGYAEELKVARQVAARETDAYNQQLEQAMSKKSEGPSRAEMYWKLAAAFAAPTKTGSFGESLGNASQVMSEHTKATREASAADTARSLQLRMTGQQARMDAAKSDVSTLRQLVGKELDDQRAMALEHMKIQLAAGKPQSEAGKIAMDKGLRPNTPEYTQFVDAYVTDKIESGRLFKDSMLSIAQQGAATRQNAETRKQAEAQMLTPTEGKAIATEQTAQDAKSTLASNLERAYQLNKRALSGSGVSKVTGAVLGAVGFPSEQLKAEEELAQILTQASLDFASRLKPMSDSDARLAQKLTGLQGTSTASRAAQIQALYEQTQAEIAQHKNRIEDVRSRKNRTKSPVPASPEGAE